MSMKLKELKQKKEYLQQELDTIYFAEASAEMYDFRKSQLEYEIAKIDESIYIEERMFIFKLSIWVFIAAGLFSIIYIGLSK